MKIVDMKDGSRGCPHRRKHRIHLCDPCTTKSLQALYRRGMHDAAAEMRVGIKALLRQMMRQLKYADEQLRRTMRKPRV